MTFGRFAAIDFETADYGRDSACAVAVVVAEGGKIVRKASALIRPPRREIYFSYLHGIEWRHVEKKPAFGAVWRGMRSLLEGVEFIAAHNASFDRGVLETCCAMEDIAPPETKYLCTVKLSRVLWNLRPTKLSDVCRHFRIPLTHHQAASDALACAKIVLKARNEEWPESVYI